MRSLRGERCGIEQDGRAAGKSHPQTILFDSYPYPFPYPYPKCLIPGTGTGLRPWYGSVQGGFRDFAVALVSSNPLVNGGASVVDVNVDVVVDEKTLISSTFTTASTSTFFPRGPPTPPD